MPASSNHISAFLVSLAEKSKAKSGVLPAKNAIAFFHRLELPLVKDPMDHVIVKRILKSASKKWSKPVKKAAPLTSAEVSRLAIIPLEGSFKDLRTAAMVLLQFSLMARYGDIQFILVKDVMLLPSGDLEVRVSIAKNYKVFEAKSSFIACNPLGRVDSVGVICRYLEARSGQPKDYLFTNLRKVKNGFLCLDTTVTSDNAVKCLREGLTRSGSPGEKFTLHSLKTGSVWEARNSKRCSVSELRRHVRWVSKDMADRYHCQSIAAKLKALKALDNNCPM